MLERKRLIKFITLPIIFFSIFVLPLWGMDRNSFKIKFARQCIEVRTNDDKYVWSTWEDAVKDQGLAEDCAQEAGFKVDGMCCAHAVACALEYVHGRSGLLASYLHKALKGDYSGGLDLEKAMKFATAHGIMALPEGQRVLHGSGNPWPDGPRYKFSGIFDPYLIYNEEKYISDCADFVTEVNLPFANPAPKSESSKVFKYILNKYNHPIVVAIHSGYKGRRDLAPFARYRGNIDTEWSWEKNVIQGEDISNAQFFGKIPGMKTYHAIVLYGYKESNKRFLIKNSWGPDSNSAGCTLPYDYFDHFTSCAYVGFGHDDWEGDGLYDEIKGKEIAQQMCSSIGNELYFDYKEKINKIIENYFLDDESYWEVQDYCGNQNCKEYMKNPHSTHHAIGKDYVVNFQQHNADTCRHCGAIKCLRFGFKNCYFKIKGQKTTGEIMNRLEELAHQNLVYYNPQSHGMHYFTRMRVITSLIMADAPEK